MGDNICPNCRGYIRETPRRGMPVEKCAYYDKERLYQAKDECNQYEKRTENQDNIKAIQWVEEKKTRNSKEDDTQSLDILQKNWDNLQDQIKGNTNKGNRFKWGSIACVIGGYMGVYGLESLPNFILLITSILLFGGLFIDLIFTKSNVEHIKSQKEIEKKIEKKYPEANTGLRSNWEFHDYTIPPLQWLYQFIGGEKVGKKRIRVNDVIFLGAILYLILSLYLVYGLPINNSGQISDTPLALSEPVRSLDITPKMYPEHIEGDVYRIRYNLKNNGTRKIENIIIDYSIPPLIDGPVRTYLENKRDLDSGETDFFWIESHGMDTSCNVTPQPFTLKFYKNKLGGLFVKYENTTSVVCVYHNIKMNISGSEFFKEFDLWYPYFKGNISMSGDGGYPLYEAYPNKSELTYQPDMNMEWTIYDISTSCLRGDFDMGWCKKYGYL